MNDPLSISLWDKIWPVESLLRELVNERVHYSAYRELVQGILLKEGFEEHHLSLDLKTPEREQELLDTFCQSQNINNDSTTLEMYLEKTQQTLDELKEKLFFHYRVDRLKQLIINERQVREAFLAQKSHRDQVLFQLIRTKSQGESEVLYETIQSGQSDFTSLALVHSIGDEAKHGGVVGPVPLRALTPKLGETLLKLSPGQVSFPFSMENGSFLIARLLRFDSAELTPRLEIAIRDDLFESWIQKRRLLAKAGANF